MLVDSIVLQRPAEWRYPGVNRLHQWARRTPWVSRDGGIALVRVASGANPCELVTAAVQLVCAYLNGPLVTVVHVDALDGDTSHTSLSPLSRIARSLALSCDLPARELKDLLADELLRQPTLFVIRARSSQELFELEQLREAFCKRETVVSLAVLAWTVGSVVSPEELVAVDTHSGVTGEALQSMFVTDSEDEAFRQFLFARIAWESAGNPSLVHALEVEVADSLDGTSQDGDIEAAFANASRKIGIPNDLLLGRLTQFLSTSESDVREQLATILAELGLLWRPEGAVSWHVPPWLTRELSKRPPLNRRAWMVRRFMHCQPLAAAISARCLSLESVLREQLVPHLRECHIPTATQNISVWRAGAIGQEFAIYPATAPCPPSRAPAIPDEDAWLWADLGDLIVTAQRAGGIAMPWPTLHRLNRLRNALAHCHPPAWAQVRALRRIIFEVEV